MPGWTEDLTAIRTWDALPRNARAYVERVSVLADVKVSMVSVGADRDETILIDNPFQR
jgi:adenylosuccinate synthase